VDTIVPPIIIDSRSPTDTSVTICSTARLRLRVATPSDSFFYHALVNDPQFLEHIGDRGIRTLADAERSLIEGTIAMQHERGHSLYVVERKEDGVPIGMCGLIRRASLPETDLGYAFLPVGRGQGFALEAARAVLALAPTLGLRRLLAIAAPANLASNRLLLKLGMRFERFVRLPPEGAGSNLYSIELGPGSVDA
jgi:RimJ/RimL family protein N-acetyltransferase